MLCWMPWTQRRAAQEQRRWRRVMLRRLRTSPHSLSLSLLPLALLLGRLDGCAAVAHSNEHHVTAVGPSGEIDGGAPPRRAGSLVTDAMPSAKEIVEVVSSGDLHQVASAGDLRRARPGGKAAVHSVPVAHPTTGSNGTATSLQHRSGVAESVVNESSAAARPVAGPDINSSSVAPAGANGAAQFHPGDGHQEEVEVVTGWVLLSVVMNIEDGPIGKGDIRGLSMALQGALSQILEVCQASVRVADMRVVEAESIAELRQETQPSAQQRAAAVPGSLVGRLSHLMRRVSILRVRPARLQQQEHLNISEVKGVYEVRIFKEMGVSAAVAANRIDRLQLYNKFAEFGSRLTRSLTSEELRFAALVTLDDVGHAWTHTEQRPALSQDLASTCIEEELLRRARWIHQYVLVLALFIVVMIVWTGSTIFTLKQPSVVPSRMNPLIGTAG